MQATIKFMRKLRLFGIGLVVSLFFYFWGVVAAQSFHNFSFSEPYGVLSDISKLKAVNEINPKFIFPLAADAPVTSPFGDRVHPQTGEWRFHAGVDLGADEGTPVLAALAGEVVFAGEQGGYGLAVQLEHGDKLRTLYAHLSKIAVQQGQSVSQRKTIGYVGSTGNSTGPHLHFEVRRQTGDGWQAVNPAAEIGDIRIAKVNLRPVVEYIPSCDTALWGKCVAPPSCKVALFGNCKP